MIDKDKAYRTLSGLRVEIFCTDLTGPYPILGAMFIGDTKQPYTWTIDGHVMDGEVSRNDIEEVLA
jgi:hypothetical protein